MWYIGIDVHKKLCHACIKDRDGKVLGELSFPNKSYGIDTLLEMIDGKDAKAVIESTGNLWIRLYLSLEEAGVEVILANPKKTKAIAEARLKNDKVDGVPWKLYDLQVKVLPRQLHVRPGSEGYRLGSNLQSWSYPTKALLGVDANPQAVT